MKKLNNIKGISSVLLTLLAIVNLFVLSHIKLHLAESEPPEWVAGIAAIIIIAMSLIVLFNLLSFTAQFRYFRQVSLLGSGAFVAGFFSLFILLVSVVMLQDIGQEWKAGFDSSGEWRFVFFSQTYQALLGILVLIQSYQFAKQLDLNGKMLYVEKDEVVFLTVHQIGIFSAVLGFVCMIFLKFINVPAGLLEGLFLITSLVALFPYVLSALCWLLIKRKEKIAEWYDEKQFMDISHSALITLGISVLISSLVFVLIFFAVIPDNILLWFPVYLCGTLFVFSLSNYVIANW